MPHGIGSNESKTTPCNPPPPPLPPSADDDRSKVYRGSMMGLPVAVKKLDETGLQGREQFFREVEVS